MSPDDVLLNPNQLQQLRGDDITIKGITFIRAVDIVARSPAVFKPARHGNTPLYALPGGGRATEREIINLLTPGDSHHA
ncbi:hypothetical protein [Thiohalophilus sp.]|uniref:hypothetical protein n=1 Tax=Thiohalophilus sp. TaxID=3028392 RepID=UPI002ACE84E3|nr:hypothetical protein [Thiohalophilus sp.]MDZ7804705.1 hypothetical protein [Thiohalophilus sp.]